MKPIQAMRVGLLGIGTVGGGTYNVLTRNAEEITRRAGRPIEITVVADKDVARAKELTGGKVKVTDDAFAVVTDPNVDIVIELIGGYGVAKELVLKAIENGKHVVTANKALLAVHGNEIFAAAQKQALFAQIVDLLTENPGLRREDVFINLIEVAKENWSFGNGVAQYA